MRISFWRHGAAAAFALLMGVGTGCSGAKFNIKAASAEYPVSVSAALPDANGNVLVVGHELEAVGTISIDRTAWGILYGQTESTIDLSTEINRQVREQGGEGVVQLRVETTHCVLNWMFPLTWLPVWPGCEDLEISGIVVRRARARASNRGEVTR